MDDYAFCARRPARKENEVADAHGGIWGGVSGQRRST